jgi:hypothetical protein
MAVNNRATKAVPADDNSVEVDAGNVPDPTVNADANPAVNGGIPSVPGTPVAPAPVEPARKPVKLTATGRVRVGRSDMERIETEIQDLIESGSLQTDGRSAVNLKGIFKKVKIFASAAAPLLSLLIPGSEEYINLINLIAGKVISGDDPTANPA